MADPASNSPFCKQPLSAAKMRYEQYIVKPDGSVVGSQRTFIGQCEIHGEVHATNKIGHHSTLGEKHLKGRYPKARRARIKGFLDPRERLQFNRALHGLHEPRPEQVSLWDRLAIEPLPTDISMWIGAKPT